MKAALKLCLLSEVPLAEDGSLPNEFRLFKAGWNATSKGNYLFDDKAAELVMAAYAQWGVDLMIDLNHDSLDLEAAVHRSDACDARGWCKLAVRSGELWAVQVSWTPDGAERLTSKKQRYVSPAFLYETESKRITCVENVAICAMPATFGTPALVAATRIDPSQRARNVAALTRVIKALRAQKAKRNGP